MPRWLSQGISEAVAHLDQAPFLQLLVPGSADSYLRHRVTTAVVQVQPCAFSKFTHDEQT